MSVLAAAVAEAAGELRERLEQFGAGTGSAPALDPVSLRLAADEVRACPGLGWGLFVIHLSWDLRTM